MEEKNKMDDEQLPQVMLVHCNGYTYKLQKPDTAEGMG